MKTLDEPERVEREHEKPEPSVSVLPTRIRVVVRVRPKLASEASHSSEILRVHPQRHLVQCSSSAAAKSFQFDQVFDGSTHQRGFYEELGVDRMLRAVLDGYHATVFAYGQTGSGKTFTMEGYDYEKPRDADQATRPQARFESSTGHDRIGLIPRTIFTLFELMARATQDASREFVVKCSFLQIYNEQILDLFNPTHFLQSTRTTKSPPVAQGGGARGTAAKHGAMPGLRLRWSAVRDFYVENLRVLECTSPDHVLQHFQDGIKHKIMASHNLNAASSRSHCIFTIYVESFDPVNNPSDVLQSKLALVDLAGSERVNKTGATGVTLQESIGINKSLFVLRQVIQALSDETTSTSHAKRDRSYIPYRDSKLTSLLKYSLGGNAWTLMIACLSPSDAYLDENLSTLLYAAKAQSIANNPTKNEDPKTILIHELKQEVESLRHQLAQAQDVILQFQQQSSPTPSHGNQQSVEPEMIEPAQAEEKRTPTQPQQAMVSSVLATGAGSSSMRPVVVESSTAVKLKLRVIDNVDMIKQLYATEKQLRDRVQAHEARVGDLQHETRVLHVENQSLREKLEVLEYLLATQPSTESDDNTPSHDRDVDEIPGYGALMASSSGTVLPGLVPSTERIRAVLGRKAMPTTNVSNQQPVSKPARPPRADAATPPTTKRPKRPDAETGLLSLSELRDLLGGKKVSNSTEMTSTQPSGPSRRGSHAQRPASNPSVVAASRDENPTASILSMLQQQKLASGGSTIDKDPLESLSELNRLLRVKATLRRSSSFK